MCKALSKEIAPIQLLWDCLRSPKRNNLNLRETNKFYLGKVIPKRLKFSDDGGIIVLNYNILSSINNNKNLLKYCNRGSILVSTTSLAYSTKAGSLTTMSRGNVEKVNSLNSQFNVTNLNIKDVSNLHQLIKSYNQIKGQRITKNPSLMKGKSYFLNIQKELKAGKFHFYNKILLNNPNTRSLDKLGFNSLKNRIVQKSLELSLLDYYNQVFSDNSHGFIKDKNIKSAIAQLDSNFQSVSYVIQVDLSNILESFNYKHYLSILSKHIKCQKLLSLLKKVLIKEYLHDWGKLSSLDDNPRNIHNILSPLLLNIYLHEFDEYMDQLLQEYPGMLNNKKKPLTREYKYLANSLRVMRYNNIPDKDLYQKTLKQLRITTRIDYNLVSPKLSYIRYFDQLIIGVEGSYTLSKEIQSKLLKKLQELNINCTIQELKITKIKDNYIKLLGYLVKSQEKFNKAIESVYEPNSKRYIKRRKKVRLSFNMDYNFITGLLIKYKFARYRNHPKIAGKIKLRGTFRGDLINKDIPDIIYYYNYIRKSIYNYYKIIKNEPALGNIM